MNGFSTGGSLRKIVPCANCFNKGGLEFRVHAAQGSEFRIYAARHSLRTPGPRERGTPNLHSRLVPILAVIPQRIVLPDTLCLFHSRLHEIFRRAAPPPVRPPPDIAVSHRIVMDVIQRRPVVPVGTYRAFDHAKENFSPANFLFAVPGV